MAMAKPKTVDEYIGSFPPKTRTALKQVRQAIKKAAPMAEETISYGIAGYKHHGMLVYFAGWSKHVSLYPAPWDVPALQKEMSAYEGSKGTIKFPLEHPMPVGLIEKMVRARIRKNEEVFAAKKKNTPGEKRIASKTAKSSDGRTVEAYLENLPAMRAETEALRKIIRAANAKISERIKWNAPSYFYGEDLVTFGPYKDARILLVFHHPAIVKIKSPILEGDYPGRRLTCLGDLKAIKKNKKEIQRILNELVRFIDADKSGRQNKSR